MVQDARPAVPAEAPAPCPPDIDMLGTQEVQMGDPEKQPGPELERQTQKLRDHAVVRPQGGMPMRSSDLRSGEEAVVIGGSMAGLLAARVLADRFDRVTVIDRDRFPDGAKFRKGVPQSRHLHALLASGLQILEQLFPGLEAEWVAAGAVPIEWPRDMLVLTRRGWSDRFPTGIKILSASREFLEWRARRAAARRRRPRSCGRGLSSTPVGATRGRRSGSPSSATRRRPRRRSPRFSAMPAATTRSQPTSTPTGGSSSSKPTRPPTRGEACCSRSKATVGWSPLPAAVGTTLPPMRKASWPSPVACAARSCTRLSGAPSG